MPAASSTLKSPFWPLLQGVGGVEMVMGPWWWAMHGLGGIPIWLFGVDHAQFACRQQSKI